MHRGDGQLNHGDFLAEAGEILEVLAGELRQAETDLERGEVPAPRVNALFRGVHSIKGISGMLAQPELSAVAHRMEDYLDRLRMGRLRMDSAALDTLFEAVEILETLIVKQRAPEQAVTALMQRLDAQLTGPSGTGGSVRTVQLDARILDALTRYEEHRLRACIQQSARVLLISVSLPLPTFDDELRRMIGDLNGFGEVISTLPSYTEGDGTEGLAFEILFATQTSNEELRERVGAGVGISEACLADVAEPPENAGVAAGPEPPANAEPSDAAEERDRTGSVRVNLDRLDRIMTSVGELIVERRKLAAQAQRLTQVDETREAGERMVQSVQDLGKKLDELQRSVIGARMVPVSQMVGRLGRLVRKLCRDTGKDVRFRAEGVRTELDKVMVDRLLSPLMHLVRNSIDHGLETPDERLRAGKPAEGRLQLRAVQRGNSVVLRIADDGRGLDLDRIRHVASERGLLDDTGDPDDAALSELLFRPGFSTSDTVTEVSGRGVGLDVVRREIQSLNGTVRLETSRGKGTLFEIELPITMAIIQSMLARSSGQIFAIPVASVSETVRTQQESVASVARNPVLRLRGKTLPMISLRDHFRLAGGADLPGYAVVMRSGDRLLAVGVDEILGQQEVVIKAIGTRLENIPGLAGATEIGEDEAALVVDPSSLAAELYGRRGAA